MSSSFATHYHEARDLFRREAQTALETLKSDEEVEQFEHPQRGPNGGSLTTDAVWLGPRTASKVLVTVSGTHGVEGFCGSGAQVDWLRRREWASLPADTAVLLVHAINPYGFAWCRRVTHENIDLNRNWIDFAGEPPASDAYETIADLISPREWNDEVSDAMLKGVRAYIATKGQKSFVQAVSSGQYKYPDGMFYGGRGESWSRDTLTRIVQKRLSRARAVAFLDYHSGLGPTGYGECICTESRDSGAYQRARSWYGERVSTTDVSVAAVIAGDWLSAMPRVLPGVTVTGIAMEFGTVPVLEVLKALVADNWFHTRSGAKASDPARAPIEAQMRAAFYCDNDVWRGMVLGQSLVACRQAINGLQTAS